MGVKKEIALLGLAGAALFAACDTGNKQRQHMPTKKDLIEINKRLVRRDSAIIAAYSDSLKLNALPDRSGLWLTIHQEGEGKQISKGQTVEYSYTISDITGEVYYTSAEDGNRKCTIGTGANVTGLDEAMLQLRKGSKATAILMPDKAYGLLGDENKIIGRRILRYDIEILSVE